MAYQSQTQVSAKHSKLQIYSVSYYLEHQKITNCQKCVSIFFTYDNTYSSFYTRITDNIKSAHPQELIFEWWIIFHYPSMAHQWCWSLLGWLFSCYIWDYLACTSLYRSNIFKHNNILKDYLSIGYQKIIYYKDCERILNCNMKTILSHFLFTI